MKHKLHRHHTLHRHVTHRIHARKGKLHKTLHTKIARRARGHVARKPHLNLNSWYRA